MNMLHQPDMPDRVQQLPIDISYLKLADWLADRKRIPADWRKKLTQLRMRVASALSSLPTDVDPWLGTLTIEDIGYLEAKRILSILTAARPEARTLFGRHSGVAGDWDAITRTYEKDLLFLGEGAQIMIQNVNYEIPYLKKQVARIQQQLADLERKESELKRNVAAAALKYQQASQELGVKGDNIRSELLSTSRRLPALFVEVEEVLCSEVIGEAIECYEAFVSYAHQKEDDGTNAVVPTLKKLRDKATDENAIECFEEISSGLSDNQAVNALEGDRLDKHENVEEGAPAAIDWDIGIIEELVESEDDKTPGLEKQNTLQGAMLVPDSIKNDDEKPFSEGFEGAIDWDTGNITMSDEIEQARQWDIDTTEQTENGQSEIQWDISVEGSNETGNVAEAICNERQPLEEFDWKPLLSSPLMKKEFRTKLLDDLLEIRTFLALRIEEINRSESISLQSQVQATAPQCLQQYGSDFLKMMSAEVSRAINLLTNRKTRDLIMICTSSRFLTRLEASLNQKKQQELKFMENLKELGQKRLELRSTLSAIWPKQEAALQRTRDIKGICERTISSFYEGRRINIMGEINSVLGKA